MEPPWSLTWTTAIASQLVLCVLMPCGGFLTQKTNLFFSNARQINSKCYWPCFRVIPTMAPSLLWAHFISPLFRLLQPHWPLAVLRAHQAGSYFCTIALIVPSFSIPSSLKYLQDSPFTSFKGFFKCHQYSEVFPFQIIIVNTWTLQSWLSRDWKKTLYISGKQISGINGHCLLWRITSSHLLSVMGMITIQAQIPEYYYPFP